MSRSQQRNAQQVTEIAHRIMLISQKPPAASDGAMPRPFGGRICTFAK